MATKPTLRTTNAPAKPNKSAPWLAGGGIVLIVIGIVSGSSSTAFIGFVLTVGGAVPLLRQRRERQAAEAAARLAKEKADAEAAAAVRQAAEEQRLAEEEDKRFAADQAATEEANTRRRVLMQVDELMNYANRLRPNGDNRQVVLSMMEAIGQIASYGDTEDRFFREEAIAHDIHLFFEQLERMGLQNEMIYRRAKRVLRQSQIGEAKAQ